MNNEKSIDISWSTLLKIGIAFIIFYILFLIKSLIIWFVFAVIISLLFDPAITFLQKRRIPRFLGAIVIYILIFGSFGLAIYTITPSFVSEIQKFTQNFPQYFEKLVPVLKGLNIPAFENLENFTNTFSGTLANASKNIFSAIAAIFGGLTSTLFVLFTAFFLSLEERPIARVLELFAPRKYEDYLSSLWLRCQTKVSGWFLSRLLASLFIGIFSFLIFFLFGADYSFSLAFLAAITNFIPIIGPIVMAILAFTIVAVGSSIVKAIFVVVAFTLLQQIEGNIISPILSKKFIGLPPVLVLLALAIGAELWGILGAILVIPLVGILYEFLRDFLAKRKAGESMTS
jgi:predicted PurR-regulated permease PerM